MLSALAVMIDWAGSTTRPLIAPRNIRKVDTISVEHVVLDSI
jgi:hypothetical protein